MDFECIKVVLNSHFVIDIVVPLLSAVIGGALTLLGVIKTLKNENKIIREERNEKSKPVLINYMCSLEKQKNIPKYVFVSDGPETEISIKGIFKNTDCGIAFIDKIVTENKTYFPKETSTVDKNTTFIIELHNLDGESLKSCRIFCHDILGNGYYYDAKFVLDNKWGSEIEIGNIQKDVKMKRGKKSFR